jgi:V8-like Glu-specific endopeptidase
MKLISILFGILLCANAFALPIPRVPDNHRMMPRNLSYHFDGIVALSNCSGSLIRFEKSQAGDQAMILTNGHCYDRGMPRPNTFAYHVPSDNTFGLFDDQAQGKGTLHATEAIYSTMTGTDITIYKLKETYQQIETTFNAHPLLLSSKHPVAATPIEIISGYWRRGYSCKIDNFVNTLKEATWTFQDSLRYSRPGCEIIGGTSGSPVLEAGTRNVIGINNTINENGGRCTMDNPCEVDKNGNVTATQGVGYGQETYQIYTCVNSANQFDLATPGCALYH